MTRPAAGRHLVPIDNVECWSSDRVWVVRKGFDFGAIREHNHGTHGFPDIAGRQLLCVRSDLGNHVLGLPERRADDSAPTIWMLQIEVQEFGRHRVRLTCLPSPSGSYELCFVAQEFGLIFGRGEVEMLNAELYGIVRNLGVWVLAQIL